MEAEILEKVKNGNAGAFAYLVNRYKNPAFSLALKMLKNHHDAEEVVQDAFVKAYKNIKGFEGKAAFSTWLYKIVYRTCLNKLGRKKYDTEEADDEKASHQVAFSQQEQFSDMAFETRKKYIKLAMESLGETDYVLLNLYYWNENKIDEISEITGLKSSAVKVRLMRARKKMYVELERLLADELNSLL
ncbi:MAG: RNA polymerase sigma factor [Chitinophagales bacterium]